MWALMARVAWQTHLGGALAGAGAALALRPRPARPAMPPQPAGPADPSASANTRS